MGTFVNINDLRNWFMGNLRGETPAPYWTLYSGDYGSREVILQFNDRVTDMDASFDMLRKTIEAMNNPAGVRFRVYQTDKPRHNVAVAQCYVQLLSNNSVVQVAGINGVGIPAEDVDAKIAKALAQAKTEWQLRAEINELKAQLNAPPEGPWARIGALAEKFMETPAAAMLIAKMTGMGFDEAKSAMVAAPPEEPATDQPDEDDTDKLNEDLDAIEEKLGQDVGDVIAKLRKFVEKDPGMAKQLLSSL